MKYPKEILDKAKELLKIYDSVYVFDKNEKTFTVSETLAPLESRGNKYKLVETLYASDFYSEKERILNYINEYNAYPDNYEGYRSKKLLEKKAKDKDMKIIFDEYGKLIERTTSLLQIGNGSAFTSELGNTSYLYDNEVHPVLFDCGSTVFAELKNSGLLMDNLTVLITHLHADHVGSLPTLIQYYYYILEQRVTIIVPKKIEDNLIQLLFLMDIDKAQYNIRTIEEGVYTKLFDGFEVAPFRTIHVPDFNFKTYGFQIKINDKKIIYSGDWKVIPKWLAKEINHLVYDELYLDVSYADENAVHLTILELSEILNPEALQRITLIHKDI